MVKRKNQSRCHCVNIRRAANAVTDYYDRSLKAAALTLNQYSLLVNIKRGQPLSVSCLAAQVGLDRTTLARSLKPLFANSLIVDEAEANKRDRQLRLTAQGQAKLKTAQPLWEKAQSDIEAILGSGNLTKLSSLLFILESLQEKLGIMPGSAP